MPQIVPMKRHVRAATKHVEDVLRRWDPIGVIAGSIEDGCPVDEYDSYAPSVVGLLSRGCTVDALASHLEKIRTEQIGLPAYQESDTAIAFELVSWWATQ